MDLVVETSDKDEYVDLSVEDNKEGNWISGGYYYFYFKSFKK